MFVQQRIYKDIYNRETDLTGGSWISKIVRYLLMIIRKFYEE